MSQGSRNDSQNRIGRDAPQVIEPKAIACPAPHQEEMNGPAHGGAMGQSAEQSDCDGKREHTKKPERVGVDDGGVKEPHGAANTTDATGTASKSLFCQNARGF